MNKEALEQLYRRYNRRRYVSPDPLEVLYRYRRLRDREVAAVVASALAYGRVASILKSVERVLAVMGSSPYQFIMGNAPDEIAAALDGFVHRFTTGRDLARLLIACRRVLTHRGSLGRAFAGEMRSEDETVVPALGRFVDILADAAGGGFGHLLPLPGRGSACKRMHLLLRWMVREDAVDPGGWRQIPPGKLVVPLDVHMHRIARALGLTSRKQADMRTALEVTAGFRRLVPEDPVRYDFVLTRLGIRKDMPTGFLGSDQEGDSGRSA